MADTNEEVVKVGVDLEIRDALTQSVKFQREMLKHMEAVSKSISSMNKANVDLGKKASKATDGWKDSVDKLGKSQKGQLVGIHKIDQALTELFKKQKSASSLEKKALEDQIKKLQDLGKRRRKQLGLDLMTPEALEEAKAGYTEAANDFKSKMKDSADEIKGVFGAFFGKDLKGMIQSSGSGVGGTLKAVIEAGAKKAELAEKLGLKGKSRAQVVGAGNAVGGAQGDLIKSLSGFTGKMGGMMRTLSSLGPILSTAGTALMAIVKLMIDAEAQAKEFQKEILTSASTAEMLAQAGGNADLAFEELDRTVRGIRDAAFSLENLEWGISHEEHKAVINTLTQEGVSIARIGQEAKRSGKPVREFAAELTHTGVAYSRAFGVPLEQIGQLQAELMTEMGMSLGQTKTAFEQMTRSATESGIAANKFFAMIRGVSQDLSLWGSRMEDAVKLLGQLGKVMNPRNAQKFMQSATQGLKNMGRQDRLRMTLLAGTGKMSKLVERDIKRKAEGLAESLGMTGDQLIKTMNTEGPAGLENAIKSMPQEMQGATREALIEMQLQMKRASKGTFGLAGAARDMGPAAALEAMQASILRLSGKSRLSDAAGDISAEMMAENLGVSEEQLNQMIKFEQAIDNQRKVLLNQLQTGGEQAAIAREALKKAGVQAKDDEELAKEIDKVGYDQIMDTLDDNTKDMLTKQTKTENFAKKQADLTQSLLQKLDVLVNFVMNQIYNVMTDIWDAIMSIPGIGTSAVDRTTKKAVMRSKDAGLMDILDKVGGDAYKFRGEVFKSGFSKNLSSVLGGAYKKDASVADIADAKFVEESISQMHAASGTTDKILSAAKAAGANPQQMAKLSESVSAGASMTQAFNAAGIGGGTRVAAVHQAAGQLDPNMLVSLVNSVNRLTGGGAPDPVQRQTEQVTQQQVSLAKEQVSTAVAATEVAQSNVDATKSVESKLEKVRLDSSFMKNQYEKTLEKAVLDAMRQALFEYYLYSEVDRGRLVGAMAERGLTAATLGHFVSEGAANKMSATQALEANARGGLVTGVNGGLATVTAAAGEGLASVGPGERILPAGAGGGLPPIHLHVNGPNIQDFARYIEGKVVDGVYEYKRRSKFT